MGEKEIPIDQAQAKIFARAIYRDIAAYIESHQKEYQEYLRQQGIGDGITDGKD